MPAASLPEQLRALTDGQTLSAALLACLAIAIPPLIAYNVPPSATFFNEAAALVGWGLWLTWLTAALPVGLPWGGASVRGGPHRAGGLAALLAMLVLLLGAALAAPLWAALPWPLALSSAGCILAAGLAVTAGAALHRAGLARPVFRAFCIAMVMAGLASSAVGIVQVYAPWAADGDWIARSTIAGRAVGNLRQPNHLSSLLLWAIVAMIWLLEAFAAAAQRPVAEAAGAARRAALAPGARRTAVRASAGISAPGAVRIACMLLALLLLFVVVLSGSRTGALGTLVLAGWGVLDRRLSRGARIGLVLAPLFYALMWAGASAWANYSHEVFGGETRFSAEGDISSSRFAIWWDTLQLIAMHPWAGVGFGEFNFAWTLTPFPHRPIAFFDNAHNLVLQFAVVLGLPLAALVLALIGWALVRAVRNAVQSGRIDDSSLGATASCASSNAQGREAMPVRRAAMVMILLIGLHSLLEYPLWYAYFLLPTAFLFGLCLGDGSAAPGATRFAEQAATPTKPRATRPLLIASMLLVLGGAASLYDYLRVVVIFAPSASAEPLDVRIAEGRHSWFFAHHADYALATTSPHPADVMAAFKRAPHFLLDARLMIAWAKALDEAGEVQRARYVAQRLKEFHNENADEFFKPCHEPPKAGETLPFQCLKPTRQFGYEDFR